MNTLYNFAPYLKTLGKSRHDFSYLDKILRKLWTKMKINIPFFGKKKEGRKGSDKISHNIVGLTEKKIRARVQPYCTLQSSFLEGKFSSCSADRQSGFPLETFSLVSFVN